MGISKVGLVGVEVVVGAGDVLVPRRMEFHSRKSRYDLKLADGSGS
jgi:hypothetical protein